MKPYWRNEEHNLSIYHGDSLDVLPELDIAFDLCITDFDYFIDNDTVITGSVKFPRNKSYESKFFNSDILDDREAQKQFTRDILDRINLKDGCVIIAFHANDKLGWIWDWGYDNGWKFVQPYCWGKANPMPQLRKVKWANGIETAAIIAKDGKRNYNPEYGHRPNYCILPVGKRDRHPTEKPIPLFMYAIESWSFPGQIVLDPFLGSGTTLSACYRLGRGGVGVDISEEFCELSAKRMEEELSQQRLFNPNESIYKPIQQELKIDG